MRRLALIWFVVLAVAAACEPEPAGSSATQPTPAGSSFATDGSPGVGTGGAHGQGGPSGALPANRIEGHAAQGMCEACHVKPDPVAGDAALKPCPRGDQRGHDPDQGPALVRLAELQNQYSAVDFDHRHHARMAAMGEGCATCHHHEEVAGRIQPCKACHAAGTGGDIARPGLKGAYHRQCLGCHREWSHVNGCGFCHMRRQGVQAVVATADRTDIVGVPHPVVEAKDTRVYHTSYPEGPLVTFRHKEHVDRFGLQCVDCHRKESCGRCHHTKEAGHPADAKREHHEPCRACHQKEIAGNCKTCHDKVEKPAFVHRWPLGEQHEDLSCRACHPTGKPIAKIDSECSACHKDLRHAWPLGPYHSRLACSACHPKGQPPSRLDRNCTRCHAGWKDHGSFDHRRTGQALDDTHRENAACTDCHPGRRYDRPPSCKGCHDDRSFPKDRPGPVVKR